MRYLFDSWDRIENLIRNSPYIFLSADYDGTLIPLASRPKGAIADKSLKELLGALSKKRRFYIGIISGRQLVDIKRLLRLKEIYYAGNHGFEIEGRGISFLHPSCKRSKPYLARIRRELLSKMKDFKGAIVEYKGASVGLHYRLVKKNLVKNLKVIFNQICVPYVNKDKVKITRGKKLLEVRPPVEWNKGSAIGKILKSLKKKRILPIYLGDDKTDEDAFLFLKNKKSITIFVGKRKKSNAKYYLKSPVEAKRFLVRLCQL